MRTSSSIAAYHGMVLARFPASIELQRPCTMLTDRSPHEVLYICLILRHRGRYCLAAAKYFVVRKDTLIRGIVGERAKEHHTIDVR
jgi:hypothetical protein